MNVRYEWKVELVVNDEPADIVDFHHVDTYQEACRVSFDEMLDNQQAYHIEICLVRDRGDEAEGLVDRQHAYVEDGKLPTHFEYGVRVPSRYHRELERY